MYSCLIGRQSFWLHLNVGMLYGWKKSPTPFQAPVARLYAGSKHVVSLTVHEIKKKKSPTSWYIYLIVRKALMSEITQPTIQCHLVRINYTSLCTSGYLISCGFWGYCTSKYPEVSHDITFVPKFSRWEPRWMQTCSTSTRIGCNTPSEWVVKFPTGR